MTTIACREIGKTFNRRRIFSNISSEVRGPGSLAITGRNGSGKSTLIRIIAGLMTPSAGSVRWEADGKEVSRDDVYRSIGFVAPYLNLYDEFSAEENVTLLETMRSGRRPNPAQVRELFDMVGLPGRRHDRVGTYSSGMKQRVKYVLALVHRPPFLLLDEPTSNLDTEGFAMVERIVREQAARGIVVVATNDADEAAWCSARIELRTG